MILGWSSFLVAAEPELVSVTRIWNEAPHNAFTDLIRFQDQFVCTFRESDGHVGGNGKIRVLASPDGVTWKSVALLSEEGIDLRDPKLSIKPQGQLMLCLGGSVYNGTKILQGRQPRVAFSSDLKTWTAPKRVLSEGDWLWRVTWHENTAYGVSYRTSPEPKEKSEENSATEEWLASLHQSRDGVNWKIICDLKVPNRPNETTLGFLPDGKMLALMRRETGDQAGWLGTSVPPYTEWSWRSLKHRLGGPNFIRLPNGELWAASRSYHPKAQTVLARLSLTDYKPALTLPSGGDTSYPGLVWHENQLWMSYYSSHEGKSSIYLAKIRFREK